MSANGPVPAYARYDWALFEDWCAAFDLPCLPADPLTLARFLDAHPAADATQIRRVTAINAVHRATQQIPPGRAQAIRERLHPGASATAMSASDRAATATEVLTRMPTAGWLGGLFGRRDAVIVMLSCQARLSFAALSRLQRSHLVFEHGAVRIGDGHDIRLPMGRDPRSCPVAIYLRWARLQAFHDRSPSNYPIAQALRKAEPVTADTVTGLQPLPRVHDRDDGPLITPFDQWGHFGARRRDRRGVNERELSRIVAAHLAGTVRVRGDRVIAVDRGEDLYDEFEPIRDVPAPLDISPTETEARYQAAIARKRRDAHYLEQELDAKYKLLDTGTDELMERLKHLVGYLED